MRNNSVLNTPRDTSFTQPNDLQRAVLTNLHLNTTENDVRSIFASCRGFKACRVRKEYSNKETRTNGWVEFDSRGSVQQALSKNGQKLHGVPIAVAAYHQITEQDLTIETMAEYDPVYKYSYFEKEVTFAMETVGKTSYLLVYPSEMSFETRRDHRVAETIVNARNGKDPYLRSSLKREILDALQNCVVMSCYKDVMIQHYAVYSSNIILVERAVRFASVSDGFTASEYQYCNTPITENIYIEKQKNSDTFFVLPYESKK
jgi:hypothetical protein